MMKRTLVLFAVVFALSAAGCTTEGGGLTGKSSHLESCFDTGNGINCVATPTGPALDGRDVNADGVVDMFVCADQESDSDSVSGESDGDGDISDSDSTSDTDRCGTDLGGSDDDSDSDSDGDVDGDADGESDEDGDSDSDGDDDGVADAIDCDCIDPPGGGEQDPGTEDPTIP